MTLIDQVLALNNAIADSVAPVAAVVPPLSTLAADPWAPWRAARGNRHFAPAKLMFIGDYTMEGYGASALANRMQCRIRDQLRHRFPTDGIGRGGGYGSWPAYYQAPTPPSPATTGSPVVGTAFGLGYRSLRVNNTQTITYNVTCTSLRIIYAGGPTTGTASVTVDGGAAVPNRPCSPSPTPRHTSTCPSARRVLTQSS